MNSSALAFMLITYIVVIGATGYFFYLALTTKPHDEPDSFTENDNVPR
ncbi:hypothetical protein L6Q79_07020 [bacterium]|nr:hypothetical protein [bacterium]NUN44687.1 hypothetical protein [bacterium]HMV27360.1 hypothetical protein [bacterium]HMW34707.1 hypothetical protein [bacterium]HMW34758.1 hypothetical protein [bacterium]